MAKVIAEFLELSCYIRTNGRVDVQAQSKEQAINLMGYFDQYPLQSYKHAHYEVYREAILLLSNLTRNPYFEDQYNALVDKLVSIQEDRSN